MPERKKPNRTNKELKQDSLIEKLVPDPSQIPDVTTLVGMMPE